MYMKNYEVKELGDFLYQLKLKGKQSRMRTRMVKLLEDRLAQVNQERTQLIEDFAKRDEEGAILTEEHEGKTGYILENPQEFNHEVAMLMSEDYIIEETADKEEMLVTIREIVLNHGEETEMSGDEAMLYDRFCEILDI